MNKTVRAMFALLFTAILGVVGCGGDPGSSDGSTDNNTSTGTGQTKREVPLNVTLTAGDVYDKVVPIASVIVSMNGEPMNGMPVPYTDYSGEPAKVNANDPSLTWVGIEVFADGYAVGMTPDGALKKEIESAESLSFTGIVACDLRTDDLQTDWSCTSTIMKNGAVWDEETVTSAITMSVDIKNGKWNWGVEAFSGIYHILGDTLSSDDPTTIASGTVTDNGHTLDFNLSYKSDPSNTVVTYHCTR